jgi:localization factor PodJL
MERMAQLLEDPSQSRLALAQIESSLKTIEARLDDTRRSLLYRDLDEAAGEGAEGDISAVAGLARALSDDVSVLKNAASASDSKTKDALEAVQDTLEAVVKRMAFLERDAELAAGAVSAPAEPPSRASRPAPTTLSPARVSGQPSFPHPRSPLNLSGRSTPPSPSRSRSGSLWPSNRQSSRSPGPSPPATRPAGGCSAGSPPAS